MNADLVFIIESEELLPGELCAVVRDNRVWDSKAMDDVEEEQYDLFGLDRGDQPSFYLFRELVYGDKQVHVAPGSSFARSDDINP